MPSSWRFHLLTVSAVTALTKPVPWRVCVLVGVVGLKMFSLNSKISYIISICYITGTLVKLEALFVQIK